MQARLERLRALLADAKADVLLIASAANRRYISGFTGSAGTALVSADGAWLVVDARYWQQADQQAGGWSVVRIPPMTRFSSVLPQLVGEHGWKRLGVEADHLTLSEFDALIAALGEPAVQWVKTTGLVEQLRAVKDDDEIRRIRAAIELTDAAMAHAAALLQPGLTEAALAVQIETFLRTQGAEALAFPTIVAFGPNSALPHHEPGDRPLLASDPVAIDMGARLDGYCADLTRSFCLAPADGRFAEVYAIVHEALRVAEHDIKAGMAGKDADATGRSVIAGHGYGDYFGHSLGHGLGLAIHETPALSRLNNTALPAGAVTTVEPGIYLPEWGGIRLEDVVLLGEDGNRVLTGAPK